MIVPARAGQEAEEARRLSRRGFLRMAAGGACAAAAIPAKSYFFFGQVLRSAPAISLARINQPWAEAMAKIALYLTVGIRL